MLKLADPAAAYEVKVDVPVPQPAGGSVPASYRGWFRIPPRSRILQMSSRTEARDTGQRTDDADLIREYIVGWQDLEDHQGRTLDFSREVLEQLLDLPYWTAATARAFMFWVLGAHEKNSATSPGR